MNHNLLYQMNTLLFWDVNINQIEKDRDSFYIIKRIMTQGDKKDRDILFQIYNNQQIKDVINQTREMPLSLKKVWLEIL